MAPGSWEHVTPRPAQEPNARIPSASPAPSIKFNSGAAALALRGANSGLAGHLAGFPSPVRPPANRAAPDPAPAYFAAVAHAEEVIPQHLHGAGPSGVDERPSEDMRQGWHPGGTHVRRRSAEPGPRAERAHRAEARSGLLWLRAATELAPAPAWSCPLFPRRSPAPCRPRPGAGSLPLRYQSDFPPWSWHKLPWVWSFAPPLLAPVGVVFLSSVSF